MSILTSERVDREIRRLRQEIAGRQAADGAFRFCLEGAPLTDAFLIILLKTLEIDGEEQLIADLAENLLRKLRPEGTWTLYDDQRDGDLSSTVEAYYALLFAGVARPGEERWQRTRQYILSMGGLSETRMLTKVMLALTGQYRWGRSLPFPIGILLIPPYFPVSFQDFSGYTRAHLVPAMVCASLKYTIRTPNTPDLSELNKKAGKTVRRNRPDADSDEFRSFAHKILSGLKVLAYLPEKIQSAALRRAEQFMLERIEPDGLFYSYMGTTFLMVFALLALGYDKSHPVIVKAIEGMKNLACDSGGHRHVRMFTSTIWDTALASHALQESGMPTDTPEVSGAARYLLSRQQYIYGDWIVRNPNTEPGGWGFSDINTKIPDVDDTSAALRAIHGLKSGDESIRKAWNRGLQWLISMQNSDGGWSAFERDTDLRLLARLPVENAEDVLTDPSTADLTGRTLEFLGQKAGLSRRVPLVEKGVQWLLGHQEPDGSWYGRWGVSYIYGTWAAVTGLTAVGVPAQQPAIQKAAAWMLSIQNRDGSFGESCESDIVKRYVPLGEGTPAQTAWAADMLLSVHRKPTPEIDRAIDYLLRYGESGKNDWAAHYPTGAALPGGYYVDYHSYRYIWPLLALAHYRKM